MKQTTKYIIALAAMFLSTMGAMASNTATIIKQIDGSAAGTVNPGNVAYDNGMITVTPADGYFLTVGDLTVVRTLDASNAEARRRTPGIDNTVVVTATDPVADPTGTTTYTFTVTDPMYDYEITANFHSKMDISSATVTVLGAPFTYTGDAITPEVNVLIGVTTLITPEETIILDGIELTQGTDYDIIYDDNIDAGIGKITIIGLRTYTGIKDDVTFTIEKATASIDYPQGSVTKAYNDEPFTNPLNADGDGIVSYTSSNPKVATVDAATGEVTIVDLGSATITATVTDSENYTYTTKTATYTITVLAADMTVSASGFTGLYDGLAHGVTVTAPEDATVKYGETEDDYDLSASPTYIKAGTYTVYYQVTKTGFTTVTGSQVVTINKAAGSINYATASVNKTKNDGAFTNPLTLTGDGKVSYTSSNTAVATVNATTGEVTINGYGTATITATVTDGENFTYTTKMATYTITVLTADMTVTASGFTGPYDGQAHGISVMAPDDATVKYGETEGVYDLSASPTYTNAGTYTVYYQVTKQNYTTVTGSEAVTITKADAKVEFAKKEYTVRIGETFNTPQVTLDPADLVVTYSSSDEEVATVDAQTGEVTLVAPGKVTITASFAGNENYNAANDSYVLEVLQRDIDPIDEDVVYAMTDDVFFVLNEDGTIEEIKLDNTVIFDILFTVDVSGDPSDNDGYDETEKCIVLNTPMSTAGVNGLIINGVEPGTDEYAEMYTGLTFMVPAGTGYVIIDAQTDGEYQMMVKIGELPPVAFNHTGREKDSLLYECSEPTWVYVYNGGKINNVRMLSNHRAKKEKGHVKIYSVTRSSSPGEGDGIELINNETQESDRWYDLQGNRIYRPTKKGVYILQGKKVIVK